LIAVVVVLGILAALAVPTFSAVKESAAEQIATRSAEGIVNEAKALAAFDGADINNDYLDAAGADTTGYNQTNNSITIDESGVVSTATITVNVVANGPDTTSITLS